MRTVKLFVLSSIITLVGCASSAEGEAFDSSSSDLHSARKPSLTAGDATPALLASPPAWDPASCSGDKLTFADLAAYFPPGQTSIHLTSLQTSVWESTCGPSGCTFRPADLGLYHVSWDRPQAVPPTFPLLAVGTANDVSFRDGNKRCATCGDPRPDDRYFLAALSGPRAWFDVNATLDGSITLSAGQPKYTITKNCVRFEASLGSSLTPRRFRVVFFGTMPPRP